ncbi:MAG TPA: DUF2934 domain-containing protein [Rudaea sp.]|nr:DUF2934 domain-containing protein [Rudaea sp.]
MPVTLIQGSSFSEVEQVVAMNKHPAVRKTKAASKPTPASVVARAKAVAKSTALGSGSKRVRPDGDARRTMIAEAAYFRSAHRGFTGGSELDDWLEAEREIARMLDL